ncbi:MAG: Gfo/Idh/MocA family oxidoreductase, partial [Candidatus Firestonebacteria bacterium]
IENKGVKEKIGLKFNKVLKVGLVGCGKIMSAHLNGYKQLREKGLTDSLIVGLCDLKKENAEMFRKRGEGPVPFAEVGPKGDPLNESHLYVSDFQQEYDAKIFTDYEAMLKEVDAVEIYTTVSTHHSLALSAISAGKHVLVEKPMAISIKAGRKIVEEAEKREVVFGVAESFRYMPMSRMRKWIIEQGYIGDIQMVVGASIGGFWSPDKIIAETSWRHCKLKAGGGAVIDAGVHGFHLLRYLVSEIEEVNTIVKNIESHRVTRDTSGKIIESIESDVDDTFFGLFRYRNGAIGQNLFSWAGHGEASNLEQTIYGTKGCIKGERIILDDGTNTTVKNFFDNNVEPGIKEKYFPKGVMDPFALETLDFLSAIQEKRQMEVNGKEGLRDLSVCFAMIESSLNGKFTKVDDIESGKIAEYEKEINEYYKL